MTRLTGGGFGSGRWERKESWCFVKRGWKSKMEFSTKSMINIITSYCLACSNGHVLP